MGARDSVKSRIFNTRFHTQRVWPGCVTPVCVGSPYLAALRNDLEVIEAFDREAHGDKLSMYQEDVEITFLEAAEKYLRAEPEPLLAHWTIIDYVKMQKNC